MITPDNRSVPHMAALGYQGAKALTVGNVSNVAQRALGVNCTVAGNVTVKFVDGSTLTFPVVVGWTIFPFEVVGVSSATATATYYNLV